MAVLLYNIFEDISSEENGSEVLSFCQSCDDCIRAKQRVCKAPGLLTSPIAPRRPMAWLHADFLCGLPTYQGKRKVLVIVDTFTKFLWTFAVSSAHSSQIIQAFTSLFSQFGPPDILTTDRESGFLSIALRPIIRLWGIKPRLQVHIIPAQWIS